MKYQAQINRRCVSKKVKAEAEILGLLMRPATETILFCHFSASTTVPVAIYYIPLNKKPR